MATVADSVALSFLGGAPFTILYDLVKLAVGKSQKFKIHLVILGATLGKIQPRVLEHIAANNSLLNIPNQTIEELRTQMAEGVVLMTKLSVISMWNIRIWGDCCNCLKPNWTEQLVELEASLQRLLSILDQERGSNVSDILVSVKYIMDKFDEFDGRLLIYERGQQELQRGQQELQRGQQELQRGQQELQRGQQEQLAVMRAQQQPSNAEREAASDLGSVFWLLFNAVIPVNVDNMVFKLLLMELKSTLECLQPLIEEIAKDNKVLHLPEQEKEDLIVQMNMGAKLVRACSKVRKYTYINALLDLNKSLQGLFIKLIGQVERCVKETMGWTINMEAVLDQIEGSGVLQKNELESEGRSSPVTLVPQPGSLCVGLDILISMQEQPRDVIKETLVDSEIIENSVKLSEGTDAVTEEEGSCELLLGELPLEPPSPGIGLDIDVQNLGVMDVKEAEGKEVVIDSAGYLSEKETLDSTADTKAGKETEGEKNRNETQGEFIFLLEALPEECLTRIIALTTPADACRLSLVSKSVMTAVDSDKIWGNCFLPRDINSILDRSVSLSESFSGYSKKFYLHLCDNPVLINEGKMSFALDKWSGRKCYMIGARDLRIVWSEENRYKHTYWKWSSFPHSRFLEVASLNNVCWLEIRGKISLSILSPFTVYRAYLVYKLTADASGFDVPVKVAIGVRHYGFEYPPLDVALGEEANKRTVFLDPAYRQINGPVSPKERLNGWLEMELGEFLCQGEEDRELEMICVETEYLSWKRGLIVQGFEVRPARNTSRESPMAKTQGKRAIADRGSEIKTSV